MRPTRRLAALLAGGLLALTACTGPTPPEEGPSSTGPTAAAPETSSSTAAAVGTVSDGHWVVGTVPEHLSAGTAHARPLPAGSYQPVADVGPGCYWWITDASLSGGDAFDAAVGSSPDEGRPIVQLRPGDHWQVWRCGAWVRID